MDPAGTQYPARQSDEVNECVFIQKGNMIFTDMVTGMQYNAEAGDRMYIPRGTTYACMTHQGVSYYWCSKKAEADGSNSNTWPSAENDAEQEKAGEMPW